MLYDVRVFKSLINQLGLNLSTQDKKRMKVNYSLVNVYTLPLLMYQVHVKIIQYHAIMSSKVF